MPLIAVTKHDRFQVDDPPPVAERRPKQRSNILAQVNHEAKALHESTILVDGHNDHLILKYSRGEAFDFMKANRRYHSDGARLRVGGVTASLFMVDGHELTRSMAMIEQTHREIEDHPDALMLITRTRDIRTAKRTGRLGIVMSWESCTALENNLDILHLAHRLGLRSSTVTHGEGGTEFALQGTPSPFGYCTDAERDSYRRTSSGLTPFGKEAVQEINGLGILLDVAHANDATFDDMLDLSGAPVISSHGGVFACSPHSRCSTDDQIRALAASGGLLSIAFFDAFIAQPPKKATVQGIVDQICYVADLVGVDHVGIGTDFDGLPDNVWPVIRTANQLPRLTQAMLKRGFTPAEVRKVWGGNYLRVLRATIG